MKIRHLEFHIWLWLASTVPLLVLQFIALIYVSITGKGEPRDGVLGILVLNVIGLTFGLMFERDRDALKKQEGEKTL